MCAAPCAGAPSGCRSPAATSVSAEVVRYLNRLSDLLFILSRGANDGDEPLWEPGRYRCSGARQVRRSISVKPEASNKPSAPIATAPMTNALWSRT